MMGWKNVYITGYDIIDEQHKNVFDITEKIDGLLNENLEISSDILSDLFEELIQYTIYHFASEEDYWREYNPEMLKIQETDHQWFIEEINHIDFELLESESRQFAVELFGKLSFWLINHVISEIEEIKKNS